MADRIVTSGKTTTYYLGNRQVTKREYQKYHPPKRIPATVAQIGSMIATWPPLVSEALAVHPEQIPEAVERDREHGLNVEYLPDGRPVFKSKGEYVRMLKSLGMHNKDGGYSG